MPSDRHPSLFQRRCKGKADARPTHLLHRPVQLPPPATSVGGTLPTLWPSPPFSSRDRFNLWSGPILVQRRSFATVYSPWHSILWAWMRWSIITRSKCLYRESYLDRDMAALTSVGMESTSQLSTVGGIRPCPTKVGCLNLENRHLGNIT